FNFVSFPNTVTVKVPSGASGYTYNNGSDTTTQNWGNAFRGMGWEGDPPAYRTGEVNSNITLSIEEE
ncbi:MAG: hypothetical protein LBD48_09515, partial [Treponema sp.]|nr:hypothetical protein [Treponema sp.]